MVFKVQLVIDRVRIQVHIFSHLKADRVAFGRVLFTERCLFSFPYKFMNWPSEYEKCPGRDSWLSIHIPPHIFERSFVS